MNKITMLLNLQRAILSAFDLKQKNEAKFARSINSKWVIFYDIPYVYYK